MRHSPRGLALALALVAPAGATAAEVETLYSFVFGTTGYNPQSGPVVGKDGTIYGTTPYGGKFNRGVVFALKRAASTGWTYQVLHDFEGEPKDGGDPLAAPELDPKTGVLYGTTLRGGKERGGVVWRLVPPAPGKTAWTYTVLHSFDSKSEGYAPVAPVTIGADGALYGSALFGPFPQSQPSSYGTVYALKPPLPGKTAWTLRTIYAFRSPTNGEEPSSKVVFDRKGSLYGTTRVGGAAGKGAVFRLTPPTAGTTWTGKTLYSFSDTSGQGYGPQSEPLVSETGTIFATVPYGGAGLGGVYVLTPNTSATHYFGRMIFKPTTESQGSSPWGGLAIDNGVLYGTSKTAMFRLTKAGNKWFSKALFVPASILDPRESEGTLVKGPDGAFYGTTYAGGANNQGAIFRLKP